LFDLGLPVEVADLPRDLAALDRLLEAPGLLAPIEAAWAIEARRHGRPSVPMDRFVRLMIVKARSGWGYETLVREVSDSLHLRRFCRVALTDRVPDESTIRKLVRRLGAEVIEQITCAVIARATGREAERRFVARAARIDSTVVEADIRYPSDLGLAGDATRMLAAEAAKASELAGPGAPRGSRPVALGGQAAAQAQPDAGRAHRAGQAGRAEADRPGRRAGRPIDPRGAAPGAAVAPARPRVRRPGQAARRRAHRAAGRPRGHGL